MLLCWGRMDLIFSDFVLKINLFDGVWKFIFVKNLSEMGEIFTGTLKCLDSP